MNPLDRVGPTVPAGHVRRPEDGRNRKRDPGAGTGAAKPGRRRDERQPDDDPDHRQHIIDDIA